MKSDEIDNFFQNNRCLYGYSSQRYRVHEVKCCRFKIDFAIVSKISPSIGFKYQGEAVKLILMIENLPLLLIDVALLVEICICERNSQV
jgi:hypothetical protein